MKIILAQPRGFCAGVNMAIQSLESALERFDAPIYVYHEIVHNTWVVRHFEQLDVTFVDSLDEVPEGSYLLYSAHGVSPEIRQQAAQRQLKTIDATCPLVTKVHNDAVRYAAQGYAIVLIGHRGHDEVVGTMGEAPDAIRLVGCEADVDQIELPDHHRGIVYLMQTTLSVSEAESIVQRLRKRFPSIIGPEKGDICYATQNRQQAVRELAAGADLMLVVGSRNSSNSRRLAELGQEQGVRAHLIDGPDDICWEWFTDTTQTVLVTAGASAPESVVQQCLQLLLQRFDARVEIGGIKEREVRFPLPGELHD